MDRYPWSGQSTIVGKAKHPWRDIDAVLSPFGDRKRRAISEYQQFIMEELGPGRKPELTGDGLSIRSCTRLRNGIFGRGSSAGVGRGLTIVSGKSEESATSLPPV